jgi:hypothetical protein
MLQQTHQLRFFAELSTGQPLGKVRFLENPGSGG